MKKKVNLLEDIPNLPSWIRRVEELCIGTKSRVEFGQGMSVTILNMEQAEQMSKKRQANSMKKSKEN